MKAIDSELEEPMPFEGGASTGECLILLVRAHEDEAQNIKIVIT